MENGLAFVKKTIKKTFQKITWLNEMYTKYKWRERTENRGTENEDKTFYVVRRATSKVGLFSHVMTNIGEIRYAITNGYIPVIDMQNNANTYLEESEIGCVNAWEYYFEQPCGCGLSDIAKSKNVILGNGMITNRNYYPTPEIVTNPALLNEWKEWFGKYIHISGEVDKKLGEVYAELFGQSLIFNESNSTNRKKILGCLCRGTDYILNKPKGHPVQPLPEQAVEKAKELKEKNKCDVVYLATEDENYYEAFKDAFGDALRVTKSGRTVIKQGDNINDVSYDRENDKYQKGLDYLINILLLANCDCLMAGNVGGTHGALLLNKNGYEDCYIFDLGVYE